MAESRSASAYMDFFHMLPENSGLAAGYFNHWNHLADFDVDAFGPRQTAMMMQRTAVAYGKFGRKTFGDGFRARLNRESPLWLRHANFKIGRSTARELQYAMWAFGSLGLQPDESYFSRWSQRAVTVMNTADDTDMCLYLKAHAYLGMKPQNKFRASYFRRLEKLLPKMDDEDAACILWSLAVIDSMHPDPANRTEAHKLLRHVDSFGQQAATLRNIPELTQLRDACLWFDLPYRHAQPYPRENTESELEHAIGRCLNGAGVTLLDETFRRCAKQEDKLVDHAFEIGGVKYWLEVDGYTHTIRTSVGKLDFDGRTRFQTALMNKQNTDKVIVRLPVQVWERALNEKGLQKGARLNALFAGFARGDSTLPLGTRAMAVTFVNGDLRLQAFTA